MKLYSYWEKELINIACDMQFSFSEGPMKEGDEKERTYLIDVYLRPLLERGVTAAVSCAETSIYDISEGTGFYGPMTLEKK